MSFSIITGFRAVCRGNPLSSRLLFPAPQHDMDETFTIEHTDGAARAGILRTAHGTIATPVFMPVGTAASVKAVAPDDLQQIGAHIILGNTYHLFLRPGDELIARMGGLHGFGAWPGAILTDSGGFQVFSLTALRKITPEGVEFRSHLDGSRHFFSPQRVISIQRNLNSDIMMVLDECVPYGADYAYTENSVALTESWAKMAREAYPSGTAANLLFGIMQGGFFRDLRVRSAEGLCALNFDGYAIGGLSVGESKAELHVMLDFSAKLLPETKPRYLMGVGTPLDIALGISQGIDMFDCVLPTRNARNGTLFTSTGKINIKRAEYAEDQRPLDADCDCYTCRTFSRAYLRHLYMSRELVSYRLNSIHNLAYYLKLARDARQAICRESYKDFLARIIATYPEEAALIGCN